MGDFIESLIDELAGLFPDNTFKLQNQYANELYWQIRDWPEKTVISLGNYCICGIGVSNESVAIVYESMASRIYDDSSNNIDFIVQCFNDPDEFKGVNGIYKLICEIAVKSGKYFSFVSEGGVDFLNLIISSQGISRGVYQEDTNL